nr:MAG TPA: hypothetical protein [Caudoviricetes sp.]
MRLYFCLILPDFVGFCCVLLPKVLPQMKKDRPHYMDGLILLHRHKPCKERC